MNIHERLKYLRAQLNLTTRAFGTAINMSGGAITNMEKGTQNVTERTIRDVCRKFNVNPDWLIHGTEPIFEDITRKLDIDDDVKQLAKQYSLLSDADRELVKRMINSLAEKIFTFDPLKRINIPYRLNYLTCNMITLMLYILCHKSGKFLPLFPKVRIKIFHCDVSISCCLTKSIQ